MTTRADRANRGGVPRQGGRSGVRLINLNRALTLAAYSFANRGKDLASEWRQESTQPRDAYHSIAEYCFMAAVPATVVTSFVFIPLADHAIGFDHLLARMVAYGLPWLPLVCSFAAFVECQLRASRESAAFDRGWTKKGYETRTRIDFIANPRVLLASSLGGAGVTLVTGVVAGVWDPFHLV